jgi:hypothetical protein
LFGTRSHLGGLGALALLCAVNRHAEGIGRPRRDRGGHGRLLSYPHLRRFRGAYKRLKPSDSSRERSPDSRAGRGRCARRSADDSHIARDQLVARVLKHDKLDLVPN